MVVKKTLRTMTLGALGLVGSLSVARAQPAPAAGPSPAPPPAPPPPAPPPVDFGVAPAALPSAPVGAAAPVPSVSWGPPPGGETADTKGALPQDEEEKPRTPFYFTRFSWNTSATTQTFGVGQDFQSHDDLAEMDFTLNLRYYFLNHTLDRAYVNVNAGVTVQLTDSIGTTTTRKYEPQLNDTVVGVGYGHTVYRSRDKQTQTTPGISASLVLPTWQQSQDQGKYLSTSLTGNVLQELPLAGSKSNWFPDLLATGSVGWSHLAARCYDPCNTNIAPLNPRQAPDGSLVYSDLLSFHSFAEDTVRLNFTYFLTLYKDLSLANTWAIQIPLDHQYPPAAIDISTGKVQLPASFVPVVPITTFDIGLSYALFNTARIDLGYVHVTPELLDNMGHRVNFFYSPTAMFYGNVSVYIDSLIDRALNNAPADHRRRIGESRFQRPVF
jgi:hypothetical protein